MPAITAITFDLWDTVFIDDSDEPERAEAGLPPKPVERRQLVHDFLSRHHEVAQDEVDLAFNTSDAAFRRVWKTQHVTWNAEQRLRVVLDGLGRSLPEQELDELVRLHEEMELRFRPKFIDGVGDALRELAAEHKLGVVSDAIFSPGRVLRELLAGEGLLDLFQGFAFSDEVGCSKPDPRMFRSAAEQLDVPLSEVVHIGDREHNDIGGAHSVGARAVLLAISRDTDLPGNTADAVCRDYGDLPAIIEGLTRD